MESVYTKGQTRAWARIEDIRVSERIALAFFLYLGLLSWWKATPLVARCFLTVWPAVLVLAWRAESAVTRTWSRVVREWLSMGLILVGYWSVEWFRTAPLVGWQRVWLTWDRALLDGWGLRAAIESAGVVFPLVLETCYLLLYTLPPLSLGLLFAASTRAGRERFLQVLFLATFFTYGMLPLFPIASPRTEYAGMDQPNVVTAPRRINTWVSDNMDITTSVFPSGHVTVAFGCVFGLVLARPRWRWLAPAVAVYACIVFVATIYGRYHFAVDGVAGILVAFAAWRAVERRTVADAV